MMILKSKIPILGSDPVQAHPVYNKPSDIYFPFVMVWENK